MNDYKRGGEDTDIRLRSPPTTPHTVKTHLSAATAAAADRRVRAALDMESKTRLPPVVPGEMTAFPTTSDAVRDKARQEGARGGSSCPRAEPRHDERKGRDRICPWPLLWIFLWSVRGQNGISTVYEAF